MSDLNNAFALCIAITPFLASFVGFSASKQWGGLQSTAGRSIAALSLGLLLWSIGEFIWSYYNIVLMEPAPYPSWADAGFAAGVFFWVVSGMYLTGLAGVRVLLKRKPILRWIAAAVILSSLVVSYYLVVEIARQGQVLTDSSDYLKVILDIAYPLGDVVTLLLVGIVVAVAGAYVGGALRLPIILVLAGMSASYVYDLTFSYTTTVETYYNAQGTDILLLVATASMSFALLSYAKNVRNLRSANALATDKTPESERKA